MRVLHFADLHLDAPFRWAGADLARRRRQSLRDTLTAVIQIAGQERVDAVLCAGDLYEQDSFSPDTVAFLTQVFSHLHPLPIYIAPGNHDWYGPASPYQQARWSPNVHIFKADRLQPVPLADGLTLWGAAHLAPAGTPGFLSSFAVDRGGAHIALFHGSERGAWPSLAEGREPHAPFRAEELEVAGIDHAFCGHYHQPRDAARHTYPGNPDPLTFGETGERGVVVACLTGDSLSRQRFRVARSEIHDLSLDVTGCASSQDVRQLVAHSLTGRSGLARVILTGELAPEAELKAADLREVAPWMDAVLPRLDQVRVGYDLDLLANDQTVRGEFVRAVRSSSLDAEEQRLVLLTGLRALEGRQDLSDIGEMRLAETTLPHAQDS